MKTRTKRALGAVSAVAVASSLFIATAAAADPIDEAQSGPQSSEKQEEPLSPVQPGSEQSESGADPIVLALVGGVAPEWVSVSGISIKTTDTCTTNGGVQLRRLEWSAVKVAGQEATQPIVTLEVYQPALTAAGAIHSKDNPSLFSVPGTGDIALGQNEYRYRVENVDTGETWTSDWIPVSVGKCVLVGKWSISGGAWYYRYSNGTYAKGLQKIDGATYYFNSSGRMLTGWQSISGSWYYFASSGAMVTGWQKIGAAWYFLKVDGKMATGWLSAGGARYYMSGSGAMLTGWQQIGGAWYLFSGSGAMVKGWYAAGGTWYYLAGSGAMVTGWQQIGSAWYLFSGSGAMLTGWQNSGGSWYYLAGSGAMVTSWQQIGGSWYYFNSGGAMVTGWLQQGSSWFYLRPSGVMVTGQQYVDGRLSNFASSGVWLGYVGGGSSGGGSTGSGSGGGATKVSPSAWGCPDSHPIKGNASSGIYHVPGGASYAKTNPEVCFATEAAAKAAGYRAAKR